MILCTAEDHHDRIDAPFSNGNHDPKHHPSLSLLDRFLQYVSIGSTANPNTDAYPSSPGQLVLGKLLAEQMKRMGLDEVEQDSNDWFGGRYLHRSPLCTHHPAQNAHLELRRGFWRGCATAGHRIVSGGDIALAKGGKVIRVADCPALQRAC